MRRMKTTLKSWVGVFQQHAELHTINSLEDWNRLKPIKVSGSFHSYNRAALAPKVATLGDNYKTLEMRGTQCLIGGACTVAEVNAFLLDHHRRLINRGNFDQQTFVGAAVTGTHGFGKAATLMDAVEHIYRIDPEDNHSPIAAVLIDTAPLTGYCVHHHAQPLSQLPPHQSRKRAYAILPYSGKDPICLIADYREILNYHQQGHSADHPSHQQLPLGKPCWPLRLYWCIDAATPLLRRLLQPLMRYYKLDRMLRTDPHDIDAIYDPAPGLSGRDTWNFAMWANRPTFTCYNIALGIRPQDTTAAILSAIQWCREQSPNLLRCFIGIRELTDTSPYELALNHDQPRNALDLYCTPRDAPKLWELQMHLEKNFDTKRHGGKSVNPQDINFKKL